MNTLQRPTTVTLALLFMALSLLSNGIKIGIYQLFADDDYALQVATAAYVFTLVFMAFLGFKIWRGRNWARVIYLLLFILGVYGTLEYIPLEAHQSLVIAGATVLQVLWQAGACVMLFLPVSHRWYMAVKNSQS